MSLSACLPPTLLLLKKVSSARLGESDIHPISPKTPAPQYQPIDGKKRKGKRLEDYSRDKAAQANKEALALLLKPASPTPSKTGLARSLKRDTENRIKVLLPGTARFCSEAVHKCTDVRPEHRMCRALIIAEQ